MTPETSIPRTVSWPEKATIALISLPVCLFFATWFRPLIGIPAMVVVAYTGWRLAGGIKPSASPSRAELLQSALIAIFMTWTSGLGGMFHQAWDHNLSNALLRDLINNPWPVSWSTPDGTILLDNNVAWSLLPALVGKILGWKAATLATALIAFVASFLMILLFSRAVGTWRWWIPFVFVLWSGLDIFGRLPRGFFPKVCGDVIVLDLWSYPIWYQSNLNVFYNISHLTLPAWLATLLIFSRSVGRKGVLGLYALLIPLVPFWAAGILPFVVWSLFQEDKTPSPRLRSLLTFENIVAPLVIFAICAPYFLGNRELGVYSCWLWDFQVHPKVNNDWVRYVSFYFLEILIPAAAVWANGIRDRQFIFTVVLLCLLPIWCIGWENEWTIYVSPPILLVLTLYTAKAFLSASRGPARWLLICVFSFGAISPVFEFLQSARATFTKDAPFEAADLQTGLLSYDPAQIPSPIWARNFVFTYHSYPLNELPILQRLLALDKHTPPHDSSSSPVAPR